MIDLSSAFDTVVISLTTAIWPDRHRHALSNAFLASSREAEKSCITNLENCLVEIKTWMDMNRLRMNSDKTEFILFGSQKQLQKCITSELNVNGIW